MGIFFQNNEGNWGNELEQQNCKRGEHGPAFWEIFLSSASVLCFPLLAEGQS